MSDLLTVKKPINFTEQEEEDVKLLVNLLNADKKKNQKKDTFSSLVRDRAIKAIRKELKDIEKEYIIW